MSENNFEVEAKLYLEKLQEQVYGFFNADGQSQEEEVNAVYVDDEFIIGWLKSRNAPYDQAAIEKFRKDWEAIIKEDQSGKTTKYEIPKWYGLLSRVIKEFDKVFEFLSYAPPKHYLFGTLPTNRVNGMAMTIPNNPYKLVILETGLFGFANLVCKVIATSFIFQETDSESLTFSTDIADCKNKIDTNPIIVERFYEVIVAYVAMGNPHYAKQYFLDKEYESVASLLRSGFEYFVFAHEFGHLIAGHLDDNEQKNYDLADSKTKEIVTNWAQEFEADFIGANILVNVMGQRGYDISLSYWGIEVFFGCVDIVEKTLSILKTGTIDLESLSETHPPILMRRERIREIISRSFDEETSKSVISISEIVEEIINHLWTKIEPAIHRLREDNVQPSYHWQ